MLSRNKNNLIKTMFTGLFVVLVSYNVSANNSLDNSISIEKKLVVSSAKSQKAIDRFAEKTIDMAADYKNTLRIIEQLQNYNTQLELIIESQEKEMISIQKQMDTIDATERGVVPLMNEMIASLDKFVQLDLPFELEKRQKRVDELKNIMIRADIQNSEKYRKILVAYQTEIAYGETFGPYQGVINMDGVETKVDFLRLGRVALVYITLDGQHVGRYNPASGGFEALDDEYIRGIELALKVASSQAAPELLKLPVPTAQGAN